MRKNRVVSWLKQTFRLQCDIKMVIFFSVALEFQEDGGCLHKLNLHMLKLFVMYGNLIITLCAVSSIIYTYIHSISTIRIIKCLLHTHQQTRNWNFCSSSPKKKHILSKKYLSKKSKWKSYRWNIQLKMLCNLFSFPPSPSSKFQVLLRNQMHDKWNNWNEHCDKKLWRIHVPLTNQLYWKA